LAALPADEWVEASFLDGELIALTPKHHDERELL